MRRSAAGAALLSCLAALNTHAAPSDAGLPLTGMVERRLAIDLDLFSRGGLEILNAIKREDYDVLRARTAISKGTKLSLALRALSGKFLPFLRLGPKGKVA